MADYVRVKTGFQKAGEPVVKGGQVLPADHPLVKGMPDEFFEPLEGAVERATRRPGEVKMTPGRGPKADTTVLSAQPAKRRGRGRDKGKQE